MMNDLKMQGLMAVKPQSMMSFMVSTRITPSVPASSFVITNDFMKVFALIGGLMVLGLLAPKSVEGHEHTGNLAGVQSLDVYAEGSKVHLLVGDYQADGKPFLLYQRSEDGGSTWSPSVRVDLGATPPNTPHRGMDAQIAASGTNIIALWSTKGTGLFDGGPMVTSISHDGGKTWKPGPNPADDKSTTGHGFTDIVADAQGTFHLVWLDSRDGKQGLRYARSTDGGDKWQKNLTLKKETCECCWNTLALGAQGPLVLFRDKDPRDMALVNSLDGGKKWGKPATVGKFDWAFNGCPHVGGGLAVQQLEKGSLVHSLVWTGMAGKSGIYHLSTQDNGQTWSAAHKLGTDDAKRCDIATNGNAVCAVWEEKDDGETVFKQSVSTDGGKTWSLALKINAAGISAAYPRVIGSGKGFRAFWTETDAHGKGVWKSASW